MTKFRFDRRRLSGPLLCLLCICPLAFSSCKPSTPMGTVKGTVTLDDKPYADAAVVFLSPTSGQASSADLQAGGMFQLPAPLPTDTYIVFLSPKVGNPTDEPKPVSIDASVPDKYWNEASSDIKIEVKEGENNVQVQLKK